MVTGNGAGASRAHGQALRVAQIGCGQISTAHFKSYSETDLVEIAVVVDSDPVAAQEAAAANGNVPWTTSFDEAIARDDVDFVSIATPHHLHAPMAAAGMPAVEAKAGAGEHTGDLFAIHLILGATKGYDFHILGHGEPLL